MKNLYSPWREAYAQEVDSKSKRTETTSQECVFCQQLAENQDEENLILKRFKHCYVMLNKYPYNAGHMLVLPLTHRAQIYDVESQVRSELMEIVSKATEIASTVLKAEGCNVGINLGKAAGAGIPSHLHIHVVPRWTGDTNFMPVVGEVKQISFDLNKMFEKLKVTF